MNFGAATAKQSTALEGIARPQHPTAECGENSGLYERDRQLFDELPDGTLVAGKYRVRGVLGRGGFATVYDAEHLDLRREVALKVLHRTSDTPSVLIERFGREVRISALVRHPHVLEVYDAGALPDGSPFLVMEKIQGTTLHDHLTAVKRLSIDETYQLTRQLLSALVSLAERGIVHRDIKPENLMLTRDEAGSLYLKLVDFGIALVRSERIERRLTMQGALVGTPHYMAPEQLRSEVVDARVDLYATGVVMYQALTGSMPYDGPDLASLTLNVLNGQAPKLRQLRPDCPPSLVRIVERALSRSPDRRYQTAASMLEDVIDCGSPSGLRCIANLPHLASSLASGSARRNLLSRSRIRQGAGALALFVGVLAWSELGTEETASRATTPVMAAQLAPPSLDDNTDAPELANDVSLTQINPTVGAEPRELEPTTTELPQREAELRPVTRAEPVVHAESKAQHDPAKAAQLSRKALTQYLHGDLSNAYATYRRATQANPAEAAAFRGLGLSASRLGKTREARRAFERYLELSPKALDAELIRARLLGLK